MKMSFKGKSFISQMFAFRPCVEPEQLLETLPSYFVRHSWGLASGRHYTVYLYLYDNTETIKLPESEASHSFTSQPAHHQPAAPVAAVSVSGWDEICHTEALFCSHSNMK